MSPARRAAFAALRSIASGRDDLGDALSRARDPLELVRDRALATTLVTGTLRWRGAIDYQLQRLVSKPLDKLDDEVLGALRLGAYQLLYLQRVPASAVVNDAVELVKAAGFRSAGGYTNAVLRRLARDREALTWPPRPASTRLESDRRAMVEHLAVTHSHPAWLVERWISRYGFDGAETWLAFNNRPPALTVAANRLRGTRDDVAVQLAREGVVTRPTFIAPHGLTVDEGRLFDTQAFKGGWCVVQDEASQIVAELVQASPGHRALDLCASPGGKTLAIAATCGRDGVVVATDVRRRRVALLTATLQRAQASHVHVASVPEDGPLPFRAAIFDRVLVDAPCSGLGTLRRDPDIRWRRQPSDLPLFARRQHALLARVADHVRRGGRLIYSTCSSEPEENEAVVRAFLADDARFACRSLTNVITLATSIRELSTPDGYLMTSPAAGLEEFFGAVLERRL